MDIKVLVPNGMVVAVSKRDPNKIVWEHKVFFLLFTLNVSCFCSFYR